MSSWICYYVHLFWLNPDVSLTVNQYNLRRGLSDTKIRLFVGTLWRQTANFAEWIHLIVEEIARVWDQEGGDGESHFKFTSMVVGSQRPLEERRCFYIAQEWKSKKSLKP